ncbi:ribosome hibernation-promoting factor, HPF/YfiA family [Sphingobacterium sp. HJSM2_6]|uniref:ribosome hibernation-promoting factor, HPF/YfiA family n=1 Tax=Sphingobacterium sp. HJSM2_6 TaxID=3366264 RepID=UPI003BEA8802
MNITVQSIKFTADRKLIEFIKKRTEKLNQFLDNIIEGVCYLRLENVEDESNKVVELKFNVPGNQLFAKAQAKSFEEATDLAIESIRRQINKHKTKTREPISHHKEILNQEDEF